MVQGTVVSQLRLNVYQVDRWIEGLPKLSFWWGKTVPSGKEQIPVGTFRCQSCGFLEAYAREEFAIK